MRIHRFKAITNQKAINMIHAAFGPDALIYSTRSVDDCVEILAGPAYSEEVVFDNATDYVVNAPQLAQANIPSSIQLEKLNSDLRTITDNIAKLTETVNLRMQEEYNWVDDELTNKRNLLMYHLNKLGFKGRFSQYFITTYLRSKKLALEINPENIAAALLKHIKTLSLDMMEHKNICALIGPTGVGKTTTLMKLAIRHMNKYSFDSIGLITTDYNDISERNQLLNFSRLHKIDLEFANDPDELQLILSSMRNKRLILIDTHGISQRDDASVNLLLQLLESQGDKIESYLILPCNVQEPILDEIARAFHNKTLQGCILTKQDECISTAPAVSISISYKMPIAYICDGQDVTQHIALANPEKLLRHIMTESMDRKRATEENLIRNVERVAKQVMPELRLG